MVSVHPNGVTIVSHHPFEWYEGNGWEHSLNGVEYHVVRNRDELLEQLRANASPERLVTTFVRQMHALFAHEHTFNGDVSGWDMSSVITTHRMFLGAHAFNGDLSAWDTSSVTDMYGMFLSARALNGDLSAWDTSNVTNMTWMFCDAHAFNCDLSAWDTSNVTNLTVMFCNARAFNGDLSAWNISRVTHMNRMFHDARSFNGDLSAWNTSNVTDMQDMFDGSAIRRIVPWCPDSKTVADQNAWKARRGDMARWRHGLNCHRDAKLCESAARYGRPMELAKRLRRGVYAGGLAFARKGAGNPHRGGLD